MSPANAAFGRTAIAGEVPIRPLDLTGRERQLRAGISAMDRIAASFCRNARRTLPFLMRHRARIVPGVVQVVSTDTEADTPREGPIFELNLGAHDATSWARITLDASAIAILLEGALGGGGSAAPAPTGRELTSAQRALLTRVGKSLASDLSTALREEVDLHMSILPAEAGDSQESSDALAVECKFEGLPSEASIVLATSAAALEAAAKEQQTSESTPGDPRMAEAMREVQLEVVAELGRMTIGLRKVLSLRVGDVIRLSTATDDAISVRVEGVEKFLGVPILSRGQLAVEIKARHER